MEEGPLIAGVEIEIASLDPRKVTVRELLGIYRLGEGNRELIECALEIEALSPIVRKELEARLAKEE